MTLSPEAQQIAIAEACGWTDMRRYGMDGYYHGCVMGNRGHGRREPLPDYLNDLNAMHEAEKVLSNEQQADWFWQMCSIIGIPQTSTHAFTFAHATAAQRAEAFLKTKGFWK